MGGETSNAKLLSRLDLRKAQVCIHMAREIAQDTLQQAIPRVVEKQEHNEPL